MNRPNAAESPVPKIPQPETPSPALLSPVLMRDINDRVNRFEMAWQAGAAPRLEDVLAAAGEEARPELFRQLLRLEVDLRLRQGRPLTAREASQRFAGLGPWAVPVLAGLGL